MYSISEIVTILLEFFQENAVFDMEADFIKVVKLPSNEKVEQAIVLAGLDRLAGEKIIVKLKEGLYVLEKPLVKYSQVLELSYPLIAAITETVNAVCQEMKDEQSLVDPLSIKEGDIANLIHIIDNYEKHGQATGKK